MPRPSFNQAKARYSHRFTCEHVPAWAREPRPDGRFYAPQYETCRQWYEATRFPGEPGLHGNSRHCLSGSPTWPLGTALDAPYTKGV